MSKSQITIITIAVFLCILITISHTYAAPTYSEYDNVRDLYELLMEKKLIRDVYGQPQHRMVRKNSRSPSLRLRFGRRSDPSLYQVNPNEEQYQSISEMSAIEN